MRMPNTLASQITQHSNQTALLIKVLEEHHQCNAVQRTWEI